MNIDLFGNEIIKDVLLRDKYVEPPFTRLDAGSGSWQNRKRLWKAKGIKSEIGRDENALKYSAMINGILILILFLVAHLIWIWRFTAIDQMI